MRMAAQVAHGRGNRRPINLLEGRVNAAFVDTFAMKPGVR
jgi:hypothetical protein